MSQENEDFLSEFDKINKVFIEKLDGIKETYPLVTMFSQSNYIKANIDFNNFIQSNGIEEKEENGEGYYTFSEEDAHKYEILERNEKIANHSIEILPNSLFISLISQFDAFLGKLIKQIFLTKPELLNSSEKNISFAKLSELKSFEEAKEFMIEKEIEGVLRESHTDHFNWLENKLKIPLRKDLEIWKEFIEITERRNLLVHNDGVVTSQYLLICRQHGVKFNSEPKIGEQLNVDEDYFKKSYNCLFELSVKLTQVVWRKLMPFDLENSDESLIDISFDLIRKNQNKLAIILLHFATETLKKYFNEESKNIFIVNLALAYKLDGNILECQRIINLKDWSASSDKFKIAKSALLDEFDETIELMQKIGKNGEVVKLSYKTWPLFIELRKKEEFKKIFKDIFDEDFTSIELPKSMIDEITFKIEESVAKFEENKIEEKTKNEPKRKRQTKKPVNSDKS